MTDGDKQKTVPWVKQMEVDYAYGYEHSYFAFRSNIWAYPYALLIAPNGVIVWGGKPSDLDEKLVRENLAGALRKPLYDWPESLGEVKKALLASKFGDARKAIATAVEENESLESYRKEVDKFLANRLAGVEALYANGDFYGAWNQAWALKTSFEGLPESETVEALCAKMNEDATLVEMYKVQKSILEIRAKQHPSKAAAKEAVAMLQSFVDKYPKTIASGEAKLGIGLIERYLDLDYYKK